MLVNLSEEGEGGGEGMGEGEEKRGEKRGGAAAARPEWRRRRGPRAGGGVARVWGERGERWLAGLTWRLPVPPISDPMAVVHP